MMRVELHAIVKFPRLAIEFRGVEESKSVHGVIDDMYSTLMKDTVV